MLINILAQLGNRYRNDRIRDPAGKRRLSLKNLLFPPEGKEISADEGNRFDPNVGKRSFLPSRNGMEWKKKRERRGGEETIGEKIRSIMAVKRHVTRSFRLIETVTL